VEETCALELWARPEGAQNCSPHHFVQYIKARKSKRMKMPFSMDMHRSRLDALLLLYNLVDKRTNTVRDLHPELITVMQQVLGL
jgi:hypothetical protein